MYREYPCKCTQCLQLSFGHCIDSNELHEKECNQIDGERYYEAEIDMEIIYLILLMSHHILHLLVEDLWSLYTLFLLRRKG